MRLEIFSDARLHLRHDPLHVAIDRRGNGAQGKGTGTLEETRMFHENPSGQPRDKLREAEAIDGICFL